jgi:hypothetical protein
VPADIAFPEPKSEPEQAATQPPVEWTAASWKDRMLDCFEESTCVITMETLNAHRGSPDAFTWKGGRFAVDPTDVADLLALEAAFHREFVQRFAKARIIDRHRQPGLRLVVDNTR